MTKKWLAQLCLVAASALCACGPSQPPAPAQNDDLTVLLRPGPASWNPRIDDQGGGIDYELMQMFAHTQGRKLRIIPAAHPTDDLIGGDHVASIAAGGVYRPDGDLFSPTAPLIYSSAYHSVEPVLIYSSDGFRPESWKDLQDESVAVLESSGLATMLASVRAAHPNIHWEQVDLPSTEALISQVSDGIVNYAVVAANEADAAHNVYLGFEHSFPVGRKRDLVWAFPPDQAALRDQVDVFFARLRQDGTLQRLRDHYFIYSQMPRLDAGVFQERIKTQLPSYRPLFERAQETTGVEWRLLASIAYQESQWDPQAISETGARGLMQLTEDTARHLGAVDRSDNDANVTGAARYLRTLKEKLPQRIKEPDRTWLALAAYNIGTAHLEDARVLAQKQKLNPDSWQAVKKALPLLALPEYYVDAKFGYARGGMPVAFVDRVRAYYDILLAQQPALGPRLRTYWGLAEPPPRIGEPALGKP
jgi:peptidoglycan lytic transglycosylase F